MDFNNTAYLVPEAEESPYLNNSINTEKTSTLDKGSPSTNPSSEDVSIADSRKDYPPERVVKAVESYLKRNPSDVKTPLTNFNNSYLETLHLAAIENYNKANNTNRQFTLKGGKRRFEVNEQALSDLEEYEKQRLSQLAISNFRKSISNPSLSENKETSLPDDIASVTKETAVGVDNSNPQQQQQQKPSQDGDVLNPETLYADNPAYDAVLELLEALKKTYQVDNVMELNITPEVVVALPVIAEQLPNIKTVRDGIELSSNHTPPEIIELTPDDRVKLVDNKAPFGPQLAHKMIVAATILPKAKQNPLTLNSSKPENLYLLKKACEELGVDYRMPNPPNLTPEQEEALDKQWAAGYKKIQNDIERLKPSDESFEKAKEGLEKSKLIAGEKEIHEKINELENLFEPVNNAKHHLRGVTNKNINDASLQEVEDALADLKTEIQNFENDTQAESLESDVFNYIDDNNLDNSNSVYQHAALFKDKGKDISQLIPHVENETIPLITVKENTAKLEAAYKPVTAALDHLTSVKTLAELENAYAATVNAWNTFSSDTNNEKIAKESLQTLEQLGIDDNHAIKINLIGALNKTEDETTIDQYKQHISTLHDIAQEERSLDATFNNVIKQRSKIEHHIRAVESNTNQGSITNTQNIIDTITTDQKTYHDALNQFIEDKRAQENRINSLPDHLKNIHRTHKNYLNRKMIGICEFDEKLSNKIILIKLELSIAETEPTPEQKVETNATPPLEKTPKRELYRGKIIKGKQARIKRKAETKKLLKARLTEPTEPYKNTDQSFIKNTQPPSPEELNQEEFDILFADTFKEKVPKPPFYQRISSAASKGFKAVSSNISSSMKEQSQLGFLPPDPFSPPTEKITPPTQEADNVKTQPLPHNRLKRKTVIGKSSDNILPAFLTKQHASVTSVAKTPVLRTIHKHETEKIRAQQGRRPT